MNSFEKEVLFQTLTYLVKIGNTCNCGPENTNTYKCRLSTNQVANKWDCLCPKHTLLAKLNACKTIQAPEARKETKLT